MALTSIPATTDASPTFDIERAAVHLVSSGSPTGMALYGLNPGDRILTARAEYASNVITLRPDSLRSP